MGYSYIKKNNNQSSGGGASHGGSSGGSSRVTQAEIIEGKKVVHNRVNNMIDNMTEVERSRTTYGSALVKLEDGTTEMWVSSAGKKDMYHQELGEMIEL